MTEPTSLGYFAPWCFRKHLLQLSREATALMFMIKDSHFHHYQKYTSIASSLANFQQYLLTPQHKILYIKHFNSILLPPSFFLVLKGNLF